MPLKDQRHLMDENPAANYQLMVTKCNSLAELQEQSGKYDLAEKIDDLRFLATIYYIRQKNETAAAYIDVGDYDRQSL